MDEIELREEIDRVKKERAKCEKFSEAWNALGQRVAELTGQVWKVRREGNKPQQAG